jgi:uncharacterized protein
MKGIPMRKVFMSLIAILSLAWALPVLAVDPSITTSGTAAVYALPDRAVISVSISAVDPEVTKACAKNEENAGKLIKAIKAAGIADGDIATDTLSIGVHYKEGTQGRSERDGFAAGRSYSVTLKDLKQIEKVFTAIAQAGVDATPYVSLQIYNARPYRDQARAMAIHAAQEKATALAKELNCTVGKAQTITEDVPGNSDYRGVPQSNAMAVDAQPTPDTPENTPIGRVQVQATVTVAFELINK